MVQKGNKGDTESCDSRIGNKDPTRNKKELQTPHSRESHEGQEPDSSPRVYNEGEEVAQRALLLPTISQRYPLFGLYKEKAGGGEGEKSSEAGPLSGPW